ncbi:hypothetical protein [Rhodococcoides kyotonense]|uniref:DUF1360 domain-containing protein n=1 Tax=Rhodococcoides kyotonense TaxID=398843 RepID=A0A239FPQ6_9NOCA|nr:hypothetical protein [Rhodococcus kyotonensis]SNS58907.1 hypothetical protein SAMN05421642_103402 [Rhodococcus kyotonensis]
MTVTVFLLALGATLRVTRFLSDDYLTRNVRAFFIRRFGEDHDLAYLAGCPWCLSIYIGGGIGTLAWFYGEHPGFLIPAICLTISWLVGIASTWLDGDA